MQDKKGALPPHLLKKGVGVALKKPLIYNRWVVNIKVKWPSIGGQGRNITNIIFK